MVVILDHDVECASENQLPFASGVLIRIVLNFILVTGYGPSQEIFPFSVGAGVVGYVYCLYGTRKHPCPGQDIYGRNSFERAFPANMISGF